MGPVAVTMGDPAGISPETVVRALAMDKLKEREIIVCGSAEILSRTAQSLRVPLEFKSIGRVADFCSGCVNVMEADSPAFGSYEYGVCDARCGRAAYEYIALAVRLALAGEIRAVATSAINKQSLLMAGIEDIGHTEIIGRLCGVSDPLTMFETDGMRIFFLTRHLPIIEACQAVTGEAVRGALVRCIDALTQLGVKDPSVAVAGLNPHCGDGGRFGGQEREHIEPAVKELAAKGLNVHGPIGADSVFHLAHEGAFDAVLSLYHDQGHIAAKTLDFYRTVSLTLGLPFLRTSVDHGTAFDIAGKGVASGTSMAEAIELAFKYSYSLKTAGFEPFKNGGTYAAEHV